MDHAHFSQRNLAPLDNTADGFFANWREAD
jgi:hypothetical protein